ncbi:MAG: TIGR02996 domain-containing protein [Myxococcota bacterium]
MREPVRRAELTELLERWRASPDPTLADVIDVMSARADAPPFTGSLAKRAELAIAACQTGSEHPEALSAILATAAAQRGLAKAAAIVDALGASWPSDPRLGTAFSEWLRHPPWTSTSSQRVWRRVFKILSGLPDRRLLALSDLEPALGFPGVTAELIDERRNRLLAADYPPPSASPDEQAAWDAVLARAREREAREVAARAELDGLRQAVFDAPDDADLRRVYADALSELGDPRGELILLQLAEAEGTADRRSRARVKALLEAHESEWLGPMHAVFSKGERVWDRGFLVGGCVRPKHQEAVIAAVGHPEWAMVRAVDLRAVQGMGARGVELVTQPCATQLLEVRGLLLADELHAVLATRRPFRVLGLATAWGEAGRLDPASLEVPPLERFEISGAWFRSLPVLQDRVRCGVASLELHLATRSVGALVGVDEGLRALPVLRAMSEQSIEVRFVHQNQPVLELVLPHGGPGSLRLGGPRVHPSYEQAIVEALPRLRGLRFGTVEVSTHWREAWETAAPYLT